MYSKIHEIFTKSETKTKGHSKKLKQMNSRRRHTNDRLVPAQAEALEGPQLIDVTGREPLANQNIRNEDVVTTRKLLS